LHTEHRLELEPVQVLGQVQAKELQAPEEAQAMELGQGLVRGWCRLLFHWYHPLVRFLAKAQELCLKMFICFMTLQAPPVGDESNKALFINDFTMELVHNAANKTLSVDKT